MGSPLFWRPWLGLVVVIVLSGLALYQWESEALLGETQGETAGRLDDTVRLTHLELAKDASPGDREKTIQRMANERHTQLSWIDDKGYVLHDSEAPGFHAQVSSWKEVFGATR